MELSACLQIDVNSAFAVNAFWLRIIIKRDKKLNLIDIYDHHHLIARRVRSQKT